MFKNSDKISIRNQVIATVLGAIIFGFLSYIIGLIELILNVINSTYNFLVDSISIPIWLFIIFIIFVLSSVLRFINSIPKVANDSEPSFLEYNKDNILGLKWRWDYSSNGDIINLYSFCPICDLQVHPHRTGSFQIIDDIGFYCEDCNREISSFDHGYNVLEDKVIRIIQKNLRNNSWVSKVKYENKSS